jgi:HD-like signal output (HDOD) protein
MDAAVCAKVLQLVNSAYFGLGQKIVSIRPAVTYLGVEIIKSLVLGSMSFSDKAISEVKGFSPDRLQQHSMLTAILAKKIVTNPALADAAFTAGLLHDIGSLVLLYAAPPDYVRALERKKELNGDSAAAEREIFGVTHAEVGAYLLGLWGIPFPIVEAVAFHHRPNEVAPEARALVAAVHIASGMIEEMTEGGQHRAPGSDLDSSARIDVSFLREAGLEDSVKKCREEAEKLLGGVAKTA